jgi:hypothetical protein
LALSGIDGGHTFLHQSLKKNVLLHKIFLPIVLSVIEDPEFFRGQYWGGKVYANIIVESTDRALQVNIKGTGIDCKILAVARSFEWQKGRSLEIPNN